jgi:predicted amidophosphoribosyltransferase
VEFSEQVRVVCGLYHKYWLVRGLMKNPNRDHNTGLMLDLKDPSDRHHAQAVRHFGTAFATDLATVFERRTDIHLAIVPGHAADSLSPGLQSIVNNHIRTAFTVVNRVNPLRRHVTVEKRSTGGSRSVESVLASVEAVDGALTQGATVVLLDDVMTTGGSLEACTSLLYKAGASGVWPFALLRTADE